MKSIIAFGSISKAVLKMRLSRIDLEQKAPHKKELIESLKESIEELSDGYLFFKGMEIESKANQKRNYDLENILLQKETELRELRKEVETLKSQLINNF